MAIPALRSSHLLAVSEPHEPIPEQKLIAAMLERAIVDVQGTDAKTGERQPQVRSALAWMNSAATYEWSFNWCCSMLDLSPSAVRKISASVLRPKRGGVRPKKQKELG